MRQTNRWATAVLVAIGLCGAATPARADDFYLGWDTVQNRIEWCNQTFAVTMVINAGANLLADQTLNGTGAADRVLIVRTTFKSTACGLYSPINYNGFQVVVNGLGGADILTGGVGETYLNGGIGNDHLIVQAAAGGANGEQDDDCVASTVAGGGETLLGFSGVDCLEQMNPGATKAASFNCGTATDDYNPGPGTIANLCEAIVPSCDCAIWF